MRVDLHLVSNLNNKGTKKNQEKEEKIETIVRLLSSSNRRLHADFKNRALKNVRASSHGQGRAQCGGSLEVSDGDGALTQLLPRLAHDLVKVKERLGRSFGGHQN